MKTAINKRLRRNIFAPVSVSQKIIIITAPSGSGKTTLVKRLLAASPHLGFSISACTRKPREGEVNGVDYYFHDEVSFRKLIAEDAFVEWEMVYTGKYYGTLKSNLADIWNTNRWPLVDIDVKGALAIKQKYPDSSLALFIQAPSLEELRKRLMLRGTENPEMLEERIEKAKEELSYASQFDKIVVNDDLDLAAAELERIVKNFLQSDAENDTFPAGLTPPVI